MKIFIAIVLVALLTGCKTKDENPATAPTKDGTVTSQKDVSNPPDNTPAKQDNEAISQKSPAPQGEMKDGMRQGQWTFFHVNGKKAAQGNYTDGLKNGQWIFWYDSGNKTAEGSFHMGRKVGKWIEYDEQENKVSEQIFADGIRVYR